MNAFDRSLRRYAARIVLILSIVFAALHTQNAFALANCGRVSLTVPVGPTGCDVQFGVSTRYDGGYETSVAMNAAGLVVETHRSDDFSIWYTVGKINAISGLTIDWGTPQKTGVRGDWPAVALGENGWVYLMYSNQGTRAISHQYYRVGTLDIKGNQGQLINWRSDAFPVSGDGGFHASLSVIGTFLVGAYETGGGNDTCSYAFGEPNNPDHGDFSIHWYTGAGNKRTITGGKCNNPHIAVAPGGRYGLGQILLVYDRDPELSSGFIAYERGSIQPAGNNEMQMYWEVGPKSVTTDSGSRPAIALLQNGLVIELHDYADELRSTVGEMNLNSWSASINWAPSESFDRLGTGTYPALTSNGSVAVQTHSRSLDGDSYPDLYYTVSSVRDRNNWMGDLASSVRSKTLQNIVIPGSHDAGMYSDQNDCGWGQTQDQDLYQQLQGGVRYFDLRVKAGNPQRIYHGQSLITCYPVSNLMIDVAQFMAQGHKEVVVLKFSHFLDFDCSQYQTLRNTVTSHLWSWMYKDAGRLAEQSLDSLTAQGGKVIVVVGNDTFTASDCGKYQGFYVYADWSSNPVNAALGQFNVFDEFADATDYDDMVADQTKKFASYNGKMENANIPCDLFLLSWTLTPTLPYTTLSVASVSLEANRNLSSRMTNWFPNSGGFIPNILFVDYYERARVTDNAVIMTQRFNPQP